MTRHPNATRAHRAPTEPDDVFTTRVVEFALWARKHVRLLGIAALAVVLVLAGALYYRSYQRTLRDQAAAQLNEVRATASSGNRQLAIRDLENFLKRFDGTPAADEARVVLAEVFLADGNPDKAIETARPLASDLDEPLGVTAAFLVASAHEAKNQAGEAEQLYLRIADRAQLAHQKRDALAAAARIRMDRGDAAGAAQLYERILESLSVTNPDRAIYEVRLGEARALASSSSRG